MMDAEEYEGTYDATPPQPVSEDETIVMGTTPEPDFESSPDVAIDGSIKTEEQEADADSGRESFDYGLLGKIRRFLFE